MRSPASQERIAALRAEIGAIERGTTPHPSLAFGLPEIDSHLPAGGLATGALHEVGAGADGLSHEAAATLFIAAMLARTKGPVFWCLKRRDLFAPGLALAGLHPDRVIYAEARTDAEVLAVVEECLRHEGLGGAVGEVGRIDMTASRRLQLAAETGGVTGFVLHRPCKAQVPTASLTRWNVTCQPTPALPVVGLLPSRWRLELARARGAEPREWIVEEPDAQGRFVMAADLVDRPAAPADERWTAERLAA